MQGKIYSTPKGDIHYWTDFTAPEAMTLVLLPGLTADHRLFDLQVKAFAGRYRILVWDAPGHGASRPFPLDFSLRDQAVWLHGILEQEEVRAFCLVGQSMGGYVAQCFLQEYPGEAAGFIAIDSAPLKRAGRCTGFIPGGPCGWPGRTAAPTPPTAGPSCAG